ncbi:MAG: MFS transporter [Thermaurantiacus tibetensis]|uniref:MFS transporter n=1 Tax=Thermaurantiacus tibetensis TaxID=2759035 RepID=UPI00188FDAB5|nr:MFS transporter [Thermaurantiacus tibetensis]
MTGPSPFAFPAWRAFFLARLTATLAQMMMVIVIGWQVYDLARRTMPVSEAAFLLGMVGLAQFLPIVGLTLLVGQLADRFDRRLIARAAIAAELACAVALLTLARLPQPPLWPLFAVAATLGAARAFAGPAMTALAPNLVPPAVLPTAIAWSSIGFQTGAVLGPLAGGLLYDRAAPLPYLAAALLLVASLSALLAIPPVPRSDAGRASVGEGLRYVRRNPIVLGAISLDLAAVILAGATAMLPIYARDILHVGAEGLGLMRAAPAIGAALVAIALTRFPLRNRVGGKLFASVGIFAVATIGFGLAPNLEVAVAALVILGAADMVSVYVRASLIQLHTPDAMRGRVSAVSLVFISASNELGEFRAGTLAALLGAVQATVLGGVLALLVTLLWARLFPALARADRLDIPDDLKAARG